MMLNMTNMMLWGLQGVSGAVAGYITNKYAVNMLFKEYTPFKIGRKVILPYKFGGVIKNRKEKFVEELSELVERDIINGITIKNQFNSDVFKKTVNKLSYDFIDKFLKESFSDFSISDISGFDKTEKEILKFTKNNIEYVISDLIKEVLGSIKISEFINNDEISKFSDNIYNIILSQIDKSSEIEEFEKVLYDSSKDILIGELLNENSKDAIKNNLNSVVDELIFNIVDNDEKIIEIINNGFEILEVDDVINKLQNRLKEKKFSEFINNQEVNEVSKYIFEKINIYMSKNGNHFISEFIDNFIKIAEETDYTIYDFLGSEFSGKIIDFLNTKLPVIMPYVSEWIINNKDELDGVIEESIDEAIGSMDPNIKKLIVSKVREFFLDNISAKNKVVNKIVSYIESYKIDDSVSEELNRKIEQYLKKTKVKDIVKILKQNNIINEKFINKLSVLFVKEYKKHGESFIEELINALLSKTIGAVIKSDFNVMINTNIKGKIVEYVLDSRDKLKCNTGKYLKKYVNDIVENISLYKIKKFISSFDLNETFKETLINNKSILNEKITKEISSYINGINLCEKYEKNKETILTKITNITLDYESDFINKYKNRKISDIIDSISDKNKFSNFIGSELINYVNSNSERVLDGKVRETVYNNLIKYDEDEICDLAQRFIGNELKPLSVFGGMLGLVAGLIFGAVFKNVNIFGFYRSVPEGILSVGLMGIIGFFTNVIAITMLFKPYKKNRVLSKVPFFNKFALGYIPAHKDKFGRSIGRTIDDDILNSTKIQNLLINNKENILNRLIHNFENSNYKALLNFINNKKNKVIKFVYESLIKKLSEEKVIFNVSEKIGNSHIKVFVSNNKFLLLKNRIKNNKSKIIKLCANYLFEKINTSKTIEEALSKHVLDNISFNMLDSINSSIYRKISNNISNESLDVFLNNYEGKYSEFINKPINEIINEDMKNSLEGYIINNVKNFIFNEFKYAAISVFKKKVINEFDENKNIGTLFDGKLKIIINENINRFTDLLINKVTNVLNNNEVIIGLKVKEEVNKNLNFFEKIAYSMAGGDSIVESCVSIAVNKKIPIFINMKFYEINNLIQKSLDNAVYPMSIEELKLKSDELNISGLLNCIFERGSNSDILSTAIENTCKVILDCVYNESFANLLKLINFNNIQSLKNKFNNDINYVLDVFKYNLEKNKNTMQEYIHRVIKEDILCKVKKMPSSRIMTGIEENDLYYALNIFIDKLFADEFVDKEIESILNNIYEDKIAGILLKDIFTQNILSRSVEKMFISILSNDEILSKLKTSITKSVDVVCDSDFEFVDSNFRREIINRVVKCVIDWGIINGKEFIEAIDLKSVTYKQIEIMDSKEIHELFNSFAGTFFKKLYIYGLFGAIFGINLYLPIIWAVRENTKTSIENMKNGYKIKDNIQ